ncbi:tandem-95 repeat protein [Vibrio campbellii]|uniref:Cadherin-like domain-containing protein n=3 Tax=Vibrio campbellii TaxID=680 RepID=A7MW49_VIBC1|nr:tandem-95 repeat protein [Vibrio campbellii]ABU71340.1 hypothetical protein VIBHAR_02378 [Vibrio campbellii ATCC BAA-1116]MBT0121918.1 tandem-95 repeat protein [Vibrio campbellii]MBT0137068.1 tandem-95 repeat protein [Vibrio campbellii]MBT0141729.1 tandem-95 repeat protein [Vibrio campbellii]MBT0146379.1 tandem-95 repeat protein [Vibrio campbellii]
MDRTSLVSFGGQLVVLGLDGKLRTLIENEQPLQGEVIVARNDAEPIGLNVQLVKENGVQNVSDDVAQILGALEAGQDPTQLGDEFASAVGQSDGSSLQASEAVDGIGAELLADTGFETIGLESLGFSQTQILSLNELYLNTLRGNETPPAVEPAAPVAGGDIVQTDEDSAIIIDVLANDEDADSENLFIESATVPEEQGTVEIEDGKLIFTPAEDFNGDADITYLVSDGELEDEASVTVAVNPINDAPVANDDSAVTDEDTPVTIDVLPNDTDVDGDTLTIVNASVPAEQGAVEIVDGKLVFTPAENFNGEATISYTVSDGVLEDSAEVSVTVNPINDVPTVENTIADQSLEEDFTPYTIDLNDAFSDVDNADGELTFSVSGNSNIQVSIVDGIATIKPTADWNGSEELTFTAEDPSGETVSQVVDFTVAAVVDIVSDSADIVEDTPTKLDVLGNDNFEGDAPVVSVEAGHEPTNGTAVVNNDGTITYTPNQDYNGPDQFTYTVSSGGVTESTTVTLNVTPVNDKPLNEDFDHSANELITNVIFDTDDKPLDEGVDSDHISDLEDDLSGDELQIRITELPTSGTLYFKDEHGALQEITSADGTLYDKDSIYYEADNVGFLLRIKDRPDTPDGAESTTDFYNWGLSADGGESHSRTEYLINGASIDISSDSGVLAQYNQKVSHIGHGIADNDGQGIQPGETISIDLSENPVGSVNLGLDGLGGLFEHGSNNAALITVTYQDAKGVEHTQVIEFLKPEGNSMLFQETSIGYGKDYGLPEGSVITQLDFSTKTSGNWELRYVEGMRPMNPRGGVVNV